MHSHADAWERDPFGKFFERCAEKMCGIAGYIGAQNRPYDDARCLAAMSDELRHRGPDDAGFWFDAASGVGLAHRRLAILDLSAEGHQPMLSRSARFVLSFNGEIYNFLELQKELRALGHNFRGGSDTEVMLAGFEEWGIEASLKRFYGMFAFALWDRQDETLFLARDRAGEKPLYYGWCGGSFLFGSELKALRRHPAWVGGIDPAALNLFFRYTYIPAPHSIHPGIHKLEPGCYLKLVPGRGEHAETRHRYWSVQEAARAGRVDPFVGSDAEAVAAVEAALARAISRQMISDVPLGAFLSGGYDSSTVVALMQAQSTTPVKTFTIGFHEGEFNEARHAKAIAQRLGTDHCELYLTQADCLDVIPRLPSLYDEPFADSSQIPTYLLAKLAREKVTVSLSGDAGDELFCGYNRYDMVESFWGKISPLPHSLRQGASALALNTPLPFLDGLCGLAGRVARRGGGLHGERIRRGAQLFAARSPEHLGELMMSYDSWADAIVKGPALRDAGEILPSLLPPSVQAGATGSWQGPSCIASQMMLADFGRYLPDDILVKVDRAAMGVSLETRIPLLDPALIELVWRLPMHLKRRNGERKWVLRQVLYRYLPREMVERPKMGFGVPIELWLRGPLRDWAESLLSERALSQSGLLNPAPVRKKWLEHQSGRYNWKYELWPVLMFQSWHVQQ